MGLFTKNKPFYPDFSQFVTDVHNHVLPGIDDGSPSQGESVRMLKEMANAGFTRVLTTPHVSTAMYPNSKETILGQFYHMKEVIAAEGIPVELEVSAEYHLDYEFLGRVQSGEVIPFGKKNYLLVELPFMNPTYSYDQILFEVQLLGFQPVIPHPERYVWLMGNKKLYQKMKDRGMLFQLNLNSLNGLYGFPAKLAAHQLIDAGMVEFIGSDAHHIGHVLDLHKVLYSKHFDKLVQSGNLLNPEL